jgi:hypothetical protein
MIVTMVAHRGWRPDGKTVYYILTYATPKTPADMIGEPYVQSDEKINRNASYSRFISIY